MPKKFVFTNEEKSKPITIITNSVRRSLCIIVQARGSRLLLSRNRAASPLYALYIRTVGHDRERESRCAGRKSKLRFANSGYELAD